MRITRRGFLRAAAAVTLGGVGLTGYTCYIEPHWVRTVRRTLPIANLPDALVGRTLVQISDLHVGRVVSSSYLIKALRHIQQLEPDILAITGDFVTYKDVHRLDALARVLEHTPHGRLATVGVLGNHDYGWKWRNPQIAERVASRISDAGITVLRNQTVNVAGLRITGLDDLWSGRFDLGQALGESGAAPRLALCHNPEGADEPGWSGYTGWILSGHTHGGQCKPPFLPPPMLPVRNRRYVAGEVGLDDGRRVYINVGLGYLLRARVNVRPEVTVFTLTRA